MTRRFLLAALFVFFASRTSFGQANGYIRINQAGYLPADTKIALAFSKSPLRGNFVLRDTAHHVVFRGPLTSVAPPNWGGRFPYYYELDFSRYRQPGRHFMQLEESGTTSQEFSIGPYLPYIRMSCSCSCANSAADHEETSASRVGRRADSREELQQSSRTSLA